MWPIAVVLGLRSRWRRHLIPLGLGAMAVIALWRAIVALGVLPWHTDWYHSSDTRIDEFLAGAVLALALHTGRLQVQSPAMRWFWGAGAPVGLAGIVAGSVLSPRIQDDPRWAYLGGLTVVALVCAAIIAATIVRPELPTSRLLRLPSMASVGRVSYAFYLWHYPVIFGLEPVLDRRITRVGTTAIAFCVTLACAHLSMLLIERPSATLRPVTMRSRPVHVAAPATGPEPRVDPRVGNVALRA